MTPLRIVCLIIWMPFALLIHLLLQIPPIRWLARSFLVWAFITDPDAPGYQPRGRIWHLLFRM